MSHLTAKSVASGSIKIEDLFCIADTIYIKERRANEQGRSVIKNLNQDVIPYPYSNITKANEYGGSCLARRDQTIYFVNKDDQAIYGINIHDNTSIKKIIMEKGCRFASLIAHPKLPLLFSVMEKKEKKRENIHSIVAIDIEKQSLCTINEGEDFYIDLALSENGNHLAFVSWTHPNMPWNATKLHICNLNDQGLPLSTEILNKETTISYIQPQFKDNDQLFYLSNQTDYWNLYLYNISSYTHTTLTHEEADCGYPPWQFGFRNYTFIKSQNLVFTISTKNGIDILSKLNLSNNILSHIPLNYTSLQQITSTKDTIILIASNYNTPQTILSIDIRSLKTTPLYQPEKVNSQDFSKQISIKFPTSDNQHAFGLLYLPQQKIDQPPLIIRCHGGPTAFAASHCQKEIAFWTTRGFAFFDINYRGSFGFGKAFQDSLKGKWGIADAQDCYFAAKYLADNYHLDPQKILIQGSSAGGYTALQVLASNPPEGTYKFAGGISSYGISDLTLLEKDTHKFEKYYLEQLLDISNSPNTLHNRSPINNIDLIKAPILFLQGEDDLVVPQNQAKILKEALLKKGLSAELIIFPNEGHGFRSAKTIEKALEASYSFYKKIISP